MKTNTILILVIILMHTITLVNVTFYDGEWDGIAMMLSNILFLIGVIYYGVEYRANKSRRG